MKVTIDDEVHGDLLQEAWTLYHDAFRDLNAQAVQRHLLRADEFGAIMLDNRVQKYLCLDDDDTLLGLSAYTNRLDAVDLISPAYFERRWPDLYDKQLIWYCCFVAVAPAAQRGGVYGALVEEMFRTAHAQDGIIALDLCRANGDGRRMATSIPLILRRLTDDVRTERMDEQSYWLYEFPRAG